MKRWLSVLLAVLMFVSVLPMGVAADGSVTAPHFYAVADKTELSPGDTFDLTVMLENNSGLVSWMVEVDFDAYALEIIGWRQGEAFAGVGDFVFSSYPISAIWYDFLNPNNTDEGSLFTITFLVTEYASAGEYVFRLYCSDYDNFSDENGDTVEVSFSDAAVTVVSCRHEYDYPCDEYCNLCGEWREAEHMYQTTADVAPPCAEHYVKHYVCMDCGYSYSQVMTPWQDHVYDDDNDRECNVCGETRDIHIHEWMEKGGVAPTCTSNGYKLVYCVGCGVMTREILPALGHVYDDDTDASCNRCGEIREVEGGCQHEYDYPCAAECYLCGAIREVEHSWELSSSLAPTCSENGLNRYHCSLCGEPYMEVIPATGEHVYDDDADPDCNVCGAEREVHVHEWMEKGGVAPTCTSNGYKLVYCVGCGVMTREILPALGHVYDDDTDASCNRCGEIREVEGGCQHEYDYPCAAECYLCGAIREVEHSWELSSSLAPTCSENGLNRYHCSLCGEPYMEVIPATGEHVYDDDADPDCNVCGETRDVHIHEWMEKGSVAPTCTSNGYKMVYCPGCGVMTREILPALGHVYDDDYDPDCNRCGETREVESICVYGVVDNSYLERGDTFTLTVMMENNLGLAGWMVDVEFDASALELIGQSKGDTFQSGNFSFSPIAAQSPANALWYNFVSPTDTADNGVLFTFTFRVKNEAVNGVQPLTLYCSDADNVINLAGNAIPVIFRGAEVWVDGCAHQYDNACDATCNFCGESRPTEGHVYQVTVREPTCEEGGIKVYTCAACGDTYFETTPAFGHAYESVVTEPTCTAPGYTVHTCLNCGNCYVGGETAPLGHAYESVVTAPTCESDGYITHTCQNCGDRYVDGEKAALGHDYQVRVDTLPTCTADGKINILDLALLQQYLNGWDVELGKK